MTKDGSTAPRKRATLEPTETQRRLLLAARAAFASDGFDGARIDDIARRAEANKQLIYHYFGNKEGLYRAAVEDAYREYRGNDVALDRIMQEPDPEEALRKLVLLLFAPRTSLEGFQRLLQDLNQPKRRQFLVSLDRAKAAYQRLIMAVADILRRGETSGVFRSGIDAREFYVTLMGACSVRIYNAATLSHMLDMELQSRTGADASLEAGLAIIMNGIRRPPGA